MYNKRWRDQIRKDLKALSIDENGRYEEATLSRGVWRAIYKDGLKEGLDQQQQQHDAMSTTDTNRVLYQEFGRSFRRESDKKRHNCAAERVKPMREQHGAAQCTPCKRWL